ncbi:ribonuclease III domain-containing protein [Alternaria rosae]|uniref:ribonuclease III domain-containing protein n=1 Tax=Alternaria rosae TaxID=1187941 RepID=UPI001E8D5F0B|nr:ribonuclease III domain-containing protein [Alternaria rosae]KAH6882498.1 ribonuclease III domain-containing protein [Alternaria rosae]
MNDMDSRILQAQTITGYHFKNKLLCAEALQMKEPNCPLRVEGTLHLFNKNRDLELVGDAVIDAVLATMWYEARDYNGERSSLAAWTQMRNDLVSNEKFAERGFNLGLDKLIIMNLGMRSPSNDMVANTFEAVVGAISVDAGDASFAAVRNALEHMGFLDHALLSRSSTVQPTIT